MAGSGGWVLMTMKGARRLHGAVAVQTFETEAMVCESQRALRRTIDYPMMRTFVGGAGAGVDAPQPIRVFDTTTLSNLTPTSAWAP